MNVVCFYTHQPSDSIKKFIPDAKYEDTSADDFAYWRAMRKYWTGDEDLVVLEHDIEVTADVIPSFTACSEPWCVYEYLKAYLDVPLHRTLRHPFATVAPKPVWWLTESLGCTKFSAEVQKLTPPEFIADDMQWRCLDNKISAMLKVAFLTAYGPSGYPYTSHSHGRLFHNHKRLPDASVPREAN